MPAMLPAWLAGACQRLEDRSRWRELLCWSIALGSLCSLASSWVQSSDIGLAKRQALLWVSVWATRGMLCSMQLFEGKI